ncbi:hypothetical protein JHK82_027568 [Glycine max]|nr:hypothetical protein JHK82_027568 [Glycine max]
MIMFSGRLRKPPKWARVKVREGGEPDDMRRQIMVIPCTFSPFGDNRVRWHTETNYGHFEPFVIQRRQAQ